MDLKSTIKKVTSLIPSLENLKEKKEFITEQVCKKLLSDS